MVSCTPVNLSKQPQLTNKEVSGQDKKEIFLKNENDKRNEIIDSVKIQKKNDNIKIDKNITLLFSRENNKNFIKQFVNVLEIGIYNKELKNVIFDVQYFENYNELKNIILQNKVKGKVFIGPVEASYTKFIKQFCDDETIFFSFTSDLDLADDCIYLLNFFPKNELETLFYSLEENSKVALLYPENEYGYMINSLVDNIINDTNAVLVNRSSYKNDLSNVRDAIKELGKYELRKYELDRQKKILYSKEDVASKKRLKKLEKFKTTTDYDFTHILIADYGLNLLQVAPLLPFYDIDPNIVQFIGTGVIDDQNFFYEPSLQGAIFPGVERIKREKLILQYENIHNESLLRVSTLPYDLLGLLNYFFSNNITWNEMLNLLTSSNIKFDGVDGSFYFRNNLIERDLDILKINNGYAKKIN